jgi:hypothetical protein
LIFIEREKRVRCELASTYAIGLICMEQHDSTPSNSSAAIAVTAAAASTVIIAICQQTQMLFLNLCFVPPDPFLHE